MDEIRLPPCKRQCGEWRARRCVLLDWNTKSLFEIRRIAGSKPCSSIRSHSNEHCYFSTWLHKRKVRLTTETIGLMLCVARNVLFSSAFAWQTLTLWTDMFNFVWTNHLCFILVLLYFEYKIAQNSCIVVKFNATLDVLTIYANVAKNT